MALLIKRSFPNGIDGTFYARIERTEGPKGTCHYTTVYYADASRANPPEVKIRNSRGEFMVPGEPIPLCVEEAWFTPDLRPGAKHHLEQAYADLKGRFADAVDS